MEPAPLWIGIDVAKDQLDIAIGSAGESWSVANDEKGIEALVQDLRNRTCGLIVLEATGGFEIPAVGALAAAGLPVVVANPRQVRLRAGHRAAGQDRSAGRAHPGPLRRTRAARGSGSPRRRSTPAGRAPHETPAGDGHDRRRT